METIDIKLDARALKSALECLGSGELMVFPTDTVYGMGTDPKDPDAVARLIEVKQRPEELPLPLLVGSVSQIMDIVELSQLASDICEEFLPGPLTVVLPYLGEDYLSLTGGRGTLGLRIPDHEFCRKIADEGGPFIGTSANIHGRLPSLCIDDARSQFGDRISLYLDGGMATDTLCSTVVEVKGDSLHVLREGLIPKSSLERFHGDR